MVVELKNLNQKKLKQEKIMAEHNLEVAFYQRYNYAATTTIPLNSVTQINEIIDGLYKKHEGEIWYENTFRRVKGKQLLLPNEMLPKEISDFIVSVGRGYLSNSGLNTMTIDPTKINLEIQHIWVTDSEENDYNPTHSHFGLMSGVIYLKIPPQVSELNEEGSFNFHHAEDGYLDVNPHESIRPKGLDMVIPKVGKLLIYPAWVKHSVSPFFGPGIRRALSFNIVCPEAADENHNVVKDSPLKGQFEGSLKIDTAGGPDAKIQGDRDLRGLADA
jgi:hypothetical protein